MDSGVTMYNMLRYRLFQVNIHIRDQRETHEALDLIFNKTMAVLSYTSEDCSSSRSCTGKLMTIMTDCMVMLQVIY